MNNFSILSKIDTSRLAAELEANHTAWQDDTYLRDYPQGPFGETDSIILRFPPRSVKQTEHELKKHLSSIDQHESVWQPISFKFPEARTVALALANTVGATRIGRIMINRVKAGGRIYRHADTPAHAWYWCRFHVVVTAEGQVDFWCGNEMKNFQTGDVFFFRNELEHEVINYSDKDRIHIVIDLRIEELKPGTFRPEPEVYEPVYPEGISYQVEHWNDIVKEFEPFIQPHWEELGLDHQDVPVALDYASYEKLDNDGFLHTVTVRKDGELIGYHISLVRTMLHYVNTLHGIVDLYYLKPEHRKSKIGVEMFKFAEASMKELGVVKIITATKLHLNHSKLLESLGYKGTELTFTKIV